MALVSRAERLDTQDRGIQETTGERTDRIPPYSGVLDLIAFSTKYFANAFPWLQSVVRQLRAVMNVISRYTCKGHPLLMKQIGNKAESGASLSPEGNMLLTFLSRWRSLAL